MAPGDALLFHGDLLHATPPNASADRPRCAVQLHYAAGRCRPCSCADAPGVLRAPNAVHPGADGAARASAAAAFDCAPEASGGGNGGPCVEPPVERVCCTPQDQEGVRQPDAAVFAHRAHVTHCFRKRLALLPITDAHFAGFVR